MADTTTPTTTESKKPWESKTMLINAVLGILMALSILIPPVHIVGDWINAHGVLIGMVWTALGIGLRFITKDKIVLTD